MKYFFAALFLYLLKKNIMETEIENIVTKWNSQCENYVLDNSKTYLYYWSNELVEFVKNLKKINITKLFNAKEYTSIIENILDSDFVNKDTKLQILKNLRDFEKNYLYQWNSKIDLYFY